MLYSLALVAAAVAIFARYQHYRYYPLFKIVPLSLLLLAFLARMPFSGMEGYVFVGLMFGLLGDVLLTFSRLFTAGLMAFLIGHICYIFAFWSTELPLQWLWFLVPWCLGMSWYLGRALLARRKGILVGPVFLYVLVSAIMIFAAASYVGKAHSWVLLLAALLFGLSDSILAINKFVRPFASAQFWILSTYFVAQSLIAYYY